MPTHRHSGLIQQAAKETLAPLGLHQKGRSRTWLDDRGFWLGIVEFQPSSWSRGSYLNVGAMWLWSEKDYLAFNVISHERKPWAAYQNDDQFIFEVRRLADIAREHVLKLRKRFPSIDAAAKFLEKQARGTVNPRHLSDAAIALGYIGRTKEARACFARLSQRTAEYDWEKEVQMRAAGLAELLANSEEFRASIEDSVRRTREMLRLPHLNNTF